MKIAFIHGRPSPHPIHTKFAQSINSKFYYVDEKMRWHDLNKSSFYRYISWFVNALFFSNKKYKYIVTESLLFPPMIIKWLGLIGKRRIIGLLDDEALYFMYSDYYSSTTNLAMKKLLSNYDGIICIGEMQTDLARKLLNNSSKRPVIGTGYNGVSEERFTLLKGLRPKLESKKIIFIGNGPYGFRGWYKGLDLMLQAFEKAFKVDKELQFCIVGKWDNDYMMGEIEKFCPHSINNVKYMGGLNDFSHLLLESSLYLHVARGEAWGISINEAMAAGIPPIVSVWTGAKESVIQVDRSLIVELDVEATCEKILWYMNLTLEEKKSLSSKCKSVVEQYKEEKAVGHFENTFNQIIEEIEQKN